MTTANASKDSYLRRSNVCIKMERKKSGSYLTELGKGKGHVHYWHIEIFCQHDAWFALTKKTVGERQLIYTAASKQMNARTTAVFDTKSVGKCTINWWDESTVCSRTTNLNLTLKGKSLAYEKPSGEDNWRKLLCLRKVFNIVKIIASKSFLCCTVLRFTGPLLSSTAHVHCYERNSRTTTILAVHLVNLCNCHHIEGRKFHIHPNHRFGKVFCTKVF